MKINIKKLGESFKDFESSQLIAELQEEQSEQEEPLFISVDPWPIEEEFFSSDGHTWKTQQEEAKAKGLEVFSVSDPEHTWYMGLVT